METILMNEVVMSICLFTAVAYVFAVAGLGLWFVFRRIVRLIKMVQRRKHAVHIEAPRKAPVWFTIEEEQHV